MTDRFSNRQVVPIDDIARSFLDPYDAIPLVVREVMRQMDERTGGRFDPRTFRLTIAPTDDVMFMEMRAVMDL